MLFSRLFDASRRLPSLCAVCRGWGAQRVCAACIDRFAPAQHRCRRCALKVPPGVSECGACIGNPPPFVRTLAAVDYDHPWDGLITQFKFRAALDLAPALAQRLLGTFERSGTPAPELLLPVPLSTERLRERGFNQAWELVRRLGRALHCDTDAQLLLRLKDTPHQLAFPPEQRDDNVRAAFAVEPRRLAEIRGRRVTLVDDVMTTGATTAVVARTPRHGDE